MSLRSEMARRLGRRAEDCCPQGVIGWARQWANPFQVPVHLADIGAAVAAATCGLSDRELCFDRGANQRRDAGSEEPAEAGGELQWPPIFGDLRTRHFRYPNQKVYGRPQGGRERGVGDS